jgi:DNA-binding cell septation regulator SpoVG
MSSLQINLIISDTILAQKGEFVSNDIYKIIVDKFNDIVNAIKNDLQKFIEQKIKALWKANLLTFTGFSYYVNN